MTKITLLFLISFFITFSSVAQEEFPTFNIANIKELKDSIKFNNAIRNAKKLVEADQLDQAQNLANQLVTLGEDIDYTAGLGAVFRLKGKIDYKLQRSVESDINFEIAEKYFKKNNDLDMLAKINNDRYIIEQNTGDLEAATEYLLGAKLYREQLQDDLGLYDIYNNLGIIYSQLNNTADSEKYLLKSIKLMEDLDIEGVGMVMNNLAVLYVEREDIDKAKKLLQKALKINKENGDLRRIAQSYGILAKAMTDTKEYKLAKKYYDTTISVGNRANHKLMVVDAIQQLGIIALEEKKYDKAHTFLSKAREGCIKTNITELILKNYKYSFKLDSSRGNLLDAIGWQKEYQKLSEKITNEANVRKVEKAKSRYEAKVKQLQLLDEREKREQKVKDKLYHYKLLAFITIAALVVILVFLFFIIKTRKERKKYIEELNASNEAKNKLFSIISHDLKNEIHGLDSSLNLMEKDTFSTDEFKEIVPLLANKTHQTSILLNNLLNWSKSQMKELQAKPANFDIREVIHTKFTFFKPKAEKKNIQLINKLNPTKIFADKDMFEIIAQNLIANAIKFCNSGDSIVLMSVEKENHYEICFKDTGVGMSPSALNKLFKESNFTSIGTDNENGTGLGLKLCKELTELNNGEIKVKSILGKGSVFSVLLPKSA